MKGGENMTNNEFEVCRLTATTIYNLLSSQIKGHIKVYVRDDVLKIEIINDTFNFRYQIENWVEKCMIGNDYEILIAGIVGCYESALRRKYFY